MSEANHTAGVVPVPCCGVVPKFPDGGEYPPYRWDRAWYVECALCGRMVMSPARPRNLVVAWNDAVRPSWRDRAMLAPILPGIVEERRRFGDWRYTLGPRAALPVPPDRDPPKPAALDWVEVWRDSLGRWYLSIAPTYSWNGCNLATDYSLGARNMADVLRMLQADERRGVAMAGPLLGSLAHDAVWQFVLELAAAWGWSKWEVLTWGDDVFRHVMQLAGTPSGQIARYYWVVHNLGHPYNYLARQFRRINPFR